MVFDIKFERELLDLDRLPFDEADTSSLEYLHLVESPTYGKKVLNLEDCMRYCDDHSVTLADLLQEVSKHYFINESEIAFSVQPCSVYFDEDVKDMTDILMREGSDVFLSCNPNTYEHKIISEACLEAVRTNSTEIFDLLAEGFMDKVKAAGSGFVQGAGRGAMNVATGTVANGLNAVANGVRSGLVRGAENMMDNNILGRAFDTKETRYEHDPKTGQLVANNNATVKNGRIHNFVNQFTDNQEVHNMVDSVMHDIRGNATGAVTDKLQSILGLAPGKPVDVGHLINSIGQKINFFGKRIAAGKGDPQQMSFFQKIINKLKQLKDKLLAKFRGH